MACGLTNTSITRLVRHARVLSIHGRWLEFASISADNAGAMGTRDNRTSGCGHGCLAALLLLLTLPSPVAAQLFNIDPLRPPADIPGAGAPPQSLAPPEEPVPAAKGPLMQSAPPPAAAPARTQTAPAIPSGQAALAVTARFGRDLPAINGGLDYGVAPTTPARHHGVS